MKTKTIYIHIGLSKTGTTSLQNFLTVNHSRLLNHNIFYPIDTQKKYIQWNQHVGLVPSLTKEKLIFFSDDENYVNGEALEEFLDDIGKIEQDNILISSEFFLRLYKDDSIKLLQTSLRNYNTKIILYVRRQDEYYISTRSERAKVGFPNRISVTNCISDTCLNDSVFLEVANYYKLINRWSKAFGKENMIVRVFEKEKLYKNDLFSDFLNIFGIEMNNTFEITKNLNETLSLEKVQLLQQLSQYLVSYSNVNNKKRFVHQEIRNFIIGSTDLFEKGKLSDFFSDGEKQQIVDYFEEGNKLLAQEYLQIESGELFGKITAHTDSLYNTTKISNDETIKAFIKLIEKFNSNFKQTERMYDRLMVSIRRQVIVQERIDFEYDYIKQNNLLDVEYYLNEYKEVLVAGLDPILHYIQFGWYEGKNPSRNFNTREYIMNNLRILDESINPLVHCFKNR
ncbi:hypothetical protein PAECIP111891_03217 [Paenibacillus allorhizoplanae]|uniref:Sulfotransferase domain-containing protein n=1 Tax=Paenibacillus allorhizoplanae TaxID=2905648 RepID=A0ABM9CA23_9BACL|nr:hypothetical protein [Paenibacillus allorhizoplanae]CAH1208424.1 hypothetical protein PAECIP111891_03217 [Paenibacillus allorhizoplanae]